MSDYIDKRAFQKAMSAAGVQPDQRVTADEWLQVWEGYATRRMSKLKSFVAGVADLVQSLKDKLRRHLAVEAEAKAELLDLAEMRDEAVALGADELVSAIARRRGTLKHRAEYAKYDAEVTRRAAEQFGVNPKELDS